MLRRSIARKNVVRDQEMARTALCRSTYSTHSSITSESMFLPRYGSTVVEIVVHFIPCSQYDNPSPMLLNVIMLRITCILSNPEETVVLIPEWSIINAAAWGEKPPMCDVVHHLVIRGSERAAGEYTTSRPSTYADAANDLQ